MIREPEDLPISKVLMPRGKGQVKTGCNPENSEKFAIVGVFYFVETMKNIREVIDMEKKARKIKKSVIAYRKKCKASGTGLSHYVLLEKENKT